MCQALRELMKDEIQKDVDAARAEGVNRGRAEGKAEGKADGIRALVDVYRVEMGLDDQTIIEKVATRFGLTSDQAKSFVLSHAV